MTPADANNPPVLKEAKLPARDWILLPLLSALTVGLLSISAELVARRVFSESEKGLASCLVLNDPVTGPRGIPNSLCREKAPETPWIEYKLNSCGYRAGMDCGPKEPGTYRIVMIGASVAMAERVRNEDSLAALLPTELSRSTGRKVELYNEGMGFRFAHNTALGFNDVLTAQPDLILWLLSAGDVSGASFTLPTVDLANYGSQGMATKIRSRFAIALAANLNADAIAELFTRTRTSLMLRHFLFKSQSQYLKSFLAGRDDVMGYVKSKPSAFWQGMLLQVDSDAAVMEGRAKAAGIPFAAALVPSRAQAAMISIGEWPEGIDPYKLGDELRSIITSHGGTFIDLSPGFRDIPNPEQYFLPVDTHPDAKGHAIISRLLAKEITGGAIPALRASAEPPTALR